MNAVLIRLRAVEQSLRAFFSDPIRRRFSYIVFLLLFALADFGLCARSARTFEFFTAKGKGTLVERRFIPSTFSREEAVSRYVAEYLLGPSDVEASYLLARGTAIRSVLIRGGTAHVDLSSAAAFPAESGVDVRSSLAILVSGIERNFPSLKHAKIYIEGHEPYAQSISGKQSKESVPKKGKSVDK